MAENLIPIEKNFFLFLNSPHTPFLDSFFYTISQAHVWVIFGLALIFISSYRQKVPEVLCFLLFIGLLIFLTDRISSGIFKPFFQRLRPTHHPSTMYLVKTVLDYKGGMYGFISSHAANFMAVGIYLALVVRDKLFSVAILILMVTVSYSRIYLGVHFVTDVLGGFVIACLTAPFVYYLYRNARHVFVHVPYPETKVPYFRPLAHRKKMFTLLVCFFYIAVLIVSPALMHLYRTDIFASRL
ncbi:MAG: phosphatase PAP2 family protein [Bacteroidales bacterium]|nr:phosphatase PAP2 family protein [Bacteroidales bacterium]